MIAAMALGAGIGGISSLANTLTSHFLNESSSKKAAKRAYKYWTKQQLEGPLLQRQGLEKAGYNPMLALSQGSASYSPNSAGLPTQAGDLVGSASKGAEIAKEAYKAAKAQIDNIEADTDLKKGQLDAVEAQRLQTEANTALLESQTDRLDLAYGRDIVDTITGVAGTASSLYSAKAMRDIARSPKETITTIHHGDKTKPTEIIKTKGVPAVDSSAKGSRPTAAPHVGSSAKSAGRIAKEFAKDIVFGLPLGLVGAGVGAGMSHVREREVKEHLKKSKDKSRKWYHNFDRFHFDY